jgi:hypothetical protein
MEEKGAFFYGHRTARSSAVLLAVRAGPALSLMALALLVACGGVDPAEGEFESIGKISAASTAVCTNGAQRNGTLVCGIGFAGVYTETCVNGKWKATTTCTAATVDYWVAPTGNDGNPGTQASPWRTLGKACASVRANSGHRIRLTAGTYTLSAQCALPPGVDLIGNGTGSTIITGAPALYAPTSSGTTWSGDKFLIGLRSPPGTLGRQVVRDFTVDGANKQIQGGLYVNGREKVELFDLAVTKTYFTGIWLWNVKSSRLHDTTIYDCSWGSSGWQSGGIHLSNLANVDLYNLTIQEVQQYDGKGGGYGIKALGSDPAYFEQVRIFDSSVRVYPDGLWNNGQAPNIAIEFCCNTRVKNSEISYVTTAATLSLVTNDATDYGVRTWRVHHSQLVMSEIRGYPLEVNNHHVEVDHNYIYNGRGGGVMIAWGTNKWKDWKFHHNIVHGIQNGWPPTVIRAPSLDGVEIVNNTFEMDRGVAVTLLSLQEGASSNVKLINNIVSRTATVTQVYPGLGGDATIHIASGTATLSNVTIKYNLFENFPPSRIIRNGSPYTPANLVVSNNLVGLDPQWVGTGGRADTYYNLKSTSPAREAGIYVGYPYEGAAPNMGAR